MFRVKQFYIYIFLKKKQDTNCVDYTGNFIISCILGLQSFQKQN